MAEFSKKMTKTMNQIPKALNYSRLVMGLVLVLCSVLEVVNYNTLAVILLRQGKPIKKHKLLNG